MSRYIDNDTDGKARVVLKSTSECRYNINDICMCRGSDIDSETLDKFDLYDNMAGGAIKYEVANMPRAEKMECAIDDLQPFILPDDRVFFVNVDRLNVFNDAGVKKYYFGEYNNEAALYIAVDTRVIGAIRVTKVNLDSMQAYTQKLSRGVKMSAESCFLDAGGQISLPEAE